MSELWYQTAFGAHYQLLYSHRDDTEAVRCMQQLEKMQPFMVKKTSTRKMVLDLGCGDGRHLKFLQEKGLSVTGLDLSEALLQAASERPDNNNVSLVRADMRTVPFLDDSFSSVFSLFTAFGYFGPLENNTSHIAQVSRILKTGGHWYFDYFDADKVRAQFVNKDQVVNNRILGPCSFKELKSLSANADLVRKQVDIRPLPGREVEAKKLGITSDGLSYTEEVAVFDLRDLDRLAATHNLHREAAAGGYDGQKLGDGDRWILVFKKV